MKKEELIKCIEALGRPSDSPNYKAGYKDAIHDVLKIVALLE